MTNGMMQAGMGMMGGGGYGGGYGGGGYGGGGYGGGRRRRRRLWGGGYGGGGYGGGSGYAPQVSATGVAASTPFAQTPQAGGGAGQTGSYLSQGIGQLPPNAPHIIPNPFDNTILVKGTPQDIEQIKTLVTQLDVPPRQVLIDAKIYEVDLDNEFAGRRGELSAEGGLDLGHRRDRQQQWHNQHQRAYIRVTGVDLRRRTRRLGPHDWRVGIQEQPTDRSPEYGGKPRKIARHLRSQHHRHGQHSRHDERRHAGAHAFVAGGCSGSANQRQFGLRQHGEQSRAPA